MNKVAIPTNNTEVDEHFGHCQFYTIISLDDNNKVLNKQLMPSPAGCGCKTDIAGILATMGVKTMIAGNMGEGAVNKLSEAGIEVLRGFKGNIDEALQKWIDGDKGDDTLCSSHDNHEYGGSCGH